MDADTYTLAETIRREIRAEMGRQDLTHRELAARLGWQRMQISRRLSGAIALSVDDVEALAVALHVPVLQLIDRLPEERNG